MQKVGGHRGPFSLVKSQEEPFNRMKGGEKVTIKVSTTKHRNEARDYQGGKSRRFFY